MQLNLQNDMPDKMALIQIDVFKEGLPFTLLGNKI